MSIIDQQTLNSMNCITPYSVLGCYPQTQTYIPPSPSMLTVERVDNGYIVTGSFRVDTVMRHRREVACDADGLAKILKRWGQGHEKTA